MICPNCGKANPEIAKFCMECGTDFRHMNTCPSCHALVAADAKFCISCGTFLTASEAIVPFINNSKIGLKVKDSGRIVAPAKYDMIFGLHDGYFRFRNSNLYGFLDKNGHETIIAQYKAAQDFSEGLAAVQIDNGRWGFINKSNKLVIDAAYVSARDFHEGIAFVQKKYNENNLEHFNKLIGIDKEGKEVINLREGKIIHDFNEGIAVFRKTIFCCDQQLDGDYYKVTKEGKIINNRIGTFTKQEATAVHQKRIKQFGCTYPDPEYEEDVIWNPWECEPDNGFKAFNNFGPMQNGVQSAHITSYYDGVKDLNDLYSLVPFLDSAGYVDKDNKKLCPFKYFSVNNFHEGLAVVREIADYAPYYLTLIGGKYGYINERFEECIPMSFDSAGDFYEGLAVVGNIIGYNTPEHEDPIYRYGYINKSGRYSIEPKYWDAKEFNYGMAPVCEPDKLYGYINLKGDYVIKPQFEDAEPFKDGLAKIRLKAEGNASFGRPGLVDIFGNILIG